MGGWTKLPLEHWNVPQNTKSLWKRNKTCAPVTITVHLQYIKSAGDGMAQWYSAGLLAA
jgi:hypothetical protein